MNPPFAVFEDSHVKSLWLYDQPQTIIRAGIYSDVAPALAEMQLCLSRGLTLVGYFAYELGYCFEPRLRVLAPIPQGPLLAFGAFARCDLWRPGRGEGASLMGDLAADWSLADYQQRFVEAQKQIEAGDVYQINLTFALKSHFGGEPLALYQALRQRQPVAYGGVAHFDHAAIVSLSPEIFFRKRGLQISVEPMKGTASRGGNPAEDDLLAQALAGHEKQRAENLMIVDLLRNDLARICQIGSVTVKDLFAVRRYPTLHQMVSRIDAELRPEISLESLIKALFPCGSITGAPKIRAMELIRALETRPRGVYCGAFGRLSPNGDMDFNVAIRTPVLYPDGRLICQVGSGIVADSTAESEYAECLMKAKFLQAKPLA